MGRIGTKAKDSKHSHHSFVISSITLELVVELNEPTTSPPLEIVLLRTLKKERQVSYQD